MCSTKSFLIPIFTLLLGVLLLPSQIFAASSSVDVDVRIPVCGDNAQEIPEECDGSDLNDQTCLSQGFFDGDLSCSLSCEFDTSECYGVAPSPSPTPSPSPSPTPTVQASPSPSASATPKSSSGSSDSGDSSSNNTKQTTSPVVTQIQSVFAAPHAAARAVLNTLEDFFTTESTQSAAINSNLPPLLRQFPLNAQNLIPKRFLPEVVQLWLDKWKEAMKSLDSKATSAKNEETCDLNLDGICDLTDFSILLSHIGGQSE